MNPILGTLTLHFITVLVVAGMLRFGWRERGRVVPLLLGFLSLIVWWIAEVYSGPLQSLFCRYTHINLHWNWSGKVAGLAVGLLIIAIMRLGASESGLTLRQRAGSVIPALVVTCALCAFSWGEEYLEHNGTDTSVERIAFQATLPGLDEETLYRGLLLALLLRSFDERWTLAKAPFGPASISTIFLFAAAHGWRVYQGAVHFDAVVFAVTGTIGAGLVWLRQRTGSLVFPILAHNLINVGDPFF